MIRLKEATEIGYGIEKEKIMKDLLESAIDSLKNLKFIRFKNSRSINEQIASVYLKDQDRECEVTMKFEYEDEKKVALRILALFEGSRQPKTYSDYHTIERINSYLIAEAISGLM